MLFSDGMVRRPIFAVRWSSFGPGSLALAFHVVGPLLVGGLVYLFLRPANLLMNHWLDAAGVGGALGPIRELTAPLAAKLPGWMIYSFPDAAWVYSLACSLGAVWSGVQRRTGYAAVAAVVVGSALMELGQVLGLVPGTFDPVDLVCIVVAGGLAAVTVHGFRSSTAGRDQE